MKVLKGIITRTILTSIIFLMIPFNIHADSTTNTAPFLGFNVQITGYGENMSSIQIPKINFSYAGNTVPSGYISGKLNCTSPSTPTSSAPCDIFSLTNNNGSYSDLAGLKVVFPLQSYLLDANGNAIINHQSYFFVDYEFILDDNYKGYVVITSSDNVAHTIYVNGNNFHYETFTQDPANPLTFTISDYQLVKSDSFYWEFPIESLPIISSFMYYNKDKLKEYYVYNNYYKFPIFSLTNGDTIYNLSSGADKFKMILFIVNNQAYNLQNIKNSLIEFGDLTVDNFVYWGNTRLWQNGATGYFVSFDITINSYTTYVIKSKATYQVIPIYFGSVYKEYVSTEFALQFGLSNRMLDNIDLIANGTNQSNQSASDLQQSTDSMQDQMDDMVDIESGYNQQFNNSLNDIDFTNPIQSNAGILPAANFVITVFNGLVNNPLSILIIIICILTIGKKVIGK